MSKDYKKKPNIVFILTDDQRFDTMGCAGNPIIKTPNLDELASQGVLFTNAFATTPICAASRASIFTGLYERTHQFTFRTPPLDDEYVDMSYPVLLRKAGYRTGFSGKYGIHTNKGATDKMFDYFQSFILHPYWREQPDGTLRHLTDIEGDKALEFLDTVNEDEPFCLSVSFNAPHADDGEPQQYFWQKECDDLYKDVVFSIPETMSDEFFNALPEALKRSESRTRFNWRFNEPEKYQEMVRGYYRMISGVDMVVGRIRNKLKEKGVDDNTIIIFTSDNGYFLGERGFADKWYLYEYSLRVPLIIYDPRNKAMRGRKISKTGLNVDIAPTILDFAGIKIPEKMQGRSLLPLLDGTKVSDWRTDFLCEHLFNNPKIPRSEGIRTEQYTYIKWLEPDLSHEELYDHVEDFEQVNNIASKEEEQPVLNVLKDRMVALRTKYELARK